MGRHLHKSWQNRRPNPTEQVKWYEPGSYGADIRLQFTNNEQRTNRWYTSPAKAEIAYEAFRQSGAILSESDITLDEVDSRA